MINLRMELANLKVMIFIHHQISEDKVGCMKTNEKLEKIVSGLLFLHKSLLIEGRIYNQLDAYEELESHFMDEKRNKITVCDCVFLFDVCEPLINLKDMFAMLAVLGSF